LIDPALLGVDDLVGEFLDLFPLGMGRGGRARLDGILMVRDHRVEERSIERIGCLPQLLDVGRRRSSHHHQVSQQSRKSYDAHGHIDV
jgi:hypothetical protein